MTIFRCGFDMLRFAANISTMFQEYAFLDRISAAANAGFNAVECQWPYDVPVLELKDKLSDAKIPLVLLNAPAGDWESGDRGLAAIAGREEEFNASIHMALEYACVLGCSNIHVLAGLSDHDSAELYLENIAWAATLLKPFGVKVLIEPINTYDVAGYFLNTTSQGIGILDRLNLNNLALQYDIYHSYRMNEVPETILRNYLDRIAHIQISDCPGRHEPGTGVIDFKKLFIQIKSIQYNGLVGCEYIPKNDTIKGLSWMEKLKC